MAAPTSTTVRCTQCTTEFDSSDVDEAQNHNGHPLVHIEQA
jgi:hypothetical protein